jgi:AcrR family transcriptional regulator
MVQQARTDWADRGRDETRRRIIDAARDLFARDGFSATSVRAIALRCRLTDAAIYYYFPGKRDILHAILVQPATSPRDEGGTPHERRTALVRQLLESFYAWTQQANLVRLLLREGLEANESTIAFSYETRSAFEESVRPALIALYGRDAPDLLRALSLLLSGLIFDGLLAHGDAFGDVAADGAFRERALSLIELAVPEVPD